MSSGDTELARRVAAMWDFLLGYRSRKCETRCDAESLWDAAIARHGLVPPQPNAIPAKLTEPAATRDGMEERATEAWVAHGGDGVPGPVRLVKFARSETLSLAAENERLRGRVAELEKERDEAREGIVSLDATRRHLLKEFERVSTDLAAMKAREEKAERMTERANKMLVEEQEKRWSAERSSPRRAPARGKKKVVKR